MRKNWLVLAEILNSEKPSLVFINEIQMYQCDSHDVVQYFEHDYCVAISSDDVYDPDLPLYKGKAKGGTMVMWQKKLDSYVKVIPATSSSYLPIVLTMPGTQISVHVALYLPTHGQDTEFVSELANLKNCLDNLVITYNDPPLFIRGDANVNEKNTNRVNIINSFKEHFNLTQVDIKHKTYHHFVGNGLFDSNVDVIFYSRREGDLEGVTESVTRILCKKNVPALNSHHDIIQTSFQLPPKPDLTVDDVELAPRIDHQQTKITWSEEGRECYSALVSNHLERLRDSWLKPNCRASMSILLSMTNTVMTRAAIITNKHRFITKKGKKKKKKLPAEIWRAKRKLNKAHCRFKSLQTTEAVLNLRFYRKQYQQTVRAYNVKTDIERDAKLYSLMGENPNKVFRAIRSLKNAKTNEIAKLTVGSQIYQGEQVADGFYYSMSALKRCDKDRLESVPKLSDKLKDYEIIISLCQQHKGIPPIDLDTSTKLLRSLRKEVKDHYSITSLHYLNAGIEGLKHFNLLLNGVISDLGNAGLEELNTAHGIILYKGHGKERTSDRAYRTISTCPLLAKATDMYIRNLYGKLWQKKEANTQYQGAGSSHDLASLLLTEVIQYSLCVTREPLYVLALDAQSAFDRCLREVLVAELYKASIPPAAIFLINKRLANRHTVYEWDGEVMGPAKDQTGFEQGGINSSDYYKLYNNEQLKSAQESSLGVDIGSGVIAAVGQADDVILLAPSPYRLQLLVMLTEEYCQKYRVKLEPGKTKLLAYCPPKLSYKVDLAMNSQQITINKTKIQRVSEVEHVGVLRHTAGNLPHIANRVAKHKKAIQALLPTGLARRHRGNPAVSVKLSQLYGVPVLLNGVASLVLTKKELEILDGHYLTTLQGLLRLHEKTPRSVIYFLAGSLPIRALLHQRMLSLFIMLCHLHEDPLNDHARHVLLLPDLYTKSWFGKIRELCLLYELSHPLMLLENPPKKETFKNLVKKRIVKYWEEILTMEAQQLPSLCFFNPRVHSLTRPHPIWLAAGSSGYGVNKATILARMISGRYRTEKLCRFWTENKNGYCLATSCDQVVGDLQHLLLHCPALDIARNNMLEMWLQKAAQYPLLHTLVSQVIQGTDKLKMTFILDPTAIPAIDHLITSYGIQVLDLVCHMAMTYVYVLHRKKLIITGRWPYATNNENFYTSEQLNDVCVAGNPGCLMKYPLSDVTSYATGQYPTHARHASLQPGPTSAVTGNQCSVYDSTGARMPVPSLPAVVGAVGHCEGDGTRGVMQSAALDHHPGLGVCGGGVGTSHVYQDTFPQYCSELASMSPAVYYQQDGILWPAVGSANTMTCNQISSYSMTCYTAMVPDHSRL